MRKNDAPKNPMLRPYGVAFFLAIIVLLVFLALNHTLYLPMGKNLADYSGDGLKNFFTFSWHLKYGEGVHFTGLFYPYGEQVTYMDAQPLWVWIIQAFEKLTSVHAENPIVYIHLILLFNLFVCSFFIFLILYGFGADYLFSVAGTVVIVLLSPQIFRFTSHYSLGNMGILPFFWWWYIQLNKKNTLVGFILFSLAVSLTGFIHPYLLLLLFFFLMPYELLSILIQKRISFIKPGALIFPVVLFLTLSKITDHSTDRPPLAWGASNFSCKWYDLLLPLNGFLKDKINSGFPSVSKDFTEGHCYISMFGIVVLLLLFYSLLQAIFKKKFVFKIDVGSPRHWVIAAVPILLFAFYIPFRWNMEWLLDYIKPIKQFRTTGRFIVGFYYPFMVFSFIYLKKIYDRNKTSGMLILAFCGLVSVYDIYNNSIYQIDSYKRFGKPDAYHFFKAKTDSIFRKIKYPGDYQCIIPYPPSTEGTEILWLDADWGSKINYFWMSYFTRLPLATIHSSRASFSRCMSLVQLSGYYSSPKPIINQFNPHKKCLVYVDNLYLKENIPLIQKAVFIDSFESHSLLCIDLHDLNYPAKNNRSFDWIDSTYILLGKNEFNNATNGSLHITAKNPNSEVLLIHLNNTENDKLLRVLFWYTPRQTDKIGLPIAAAYAVNNGQESFLKDWREKHTITYNYVDGWFCVDYILPVNKDIKDIQFKLSSDDILADDFYVFAKK